MATLPHILLGIVRATLAGRGLGRDRRLPEGDRRRARGDHDDHAQLDRDLGRHVPRSATAARSRTPRTRRVPISNDVADGAKLPVFWGDKELQGLHIGFFVAIAALVVFWLLLTGRRSATRCARSASTPRRPHYGGISVKKNLIRAMAISGAFAGLAGGLDMLGYLYRYGVSDIPVSAVGFLGIAVALLGRNTAVGVGLAALLFGALLFGTTHGLQSSAIDPQLASNLTYMIQGLIVLFVGADVMILSVWNRAGSVTAAAQRGKPPAAASMTRAERPRRRRWARARRRAPSAPSACCSASLACFLTLPPIEARSIVWSVLVGIVALACGIWAVDARRAPARLGGGRVGPRRDRPRRPRDPSSTDNLNTVFRRRPDRVDVRVLDAARLRRHRRHVLRAQRRREHRPRGDDADGRLLRRLRRRQGRQLGRRPPRRDARRRPAGARARVLRDPPARRPDRRRRRRSTSSRSGSPATSSSSSTTARTCRSGSRRSRT